MLRVGDAFCVFIARNFIIVEEGVESDGKNVKTDVKDNRSGFSGVRYCVHSTIIVLDLKRR